MLCCLRQCQPGRLTFLRALRTNLAEQVAPSSCPGDTTGARQRGLRQGRPASDEEEPVPSTSGFPGRSKADLPMTWQLREGFHPQAGRQWAFQVGLVWVRRRYTGGSPLPTNYKAFPCQALGMADKTLEFKTSCTAEPEFPDSVGHFPGSPQTEASGTGAFPQCPAPCSTPEINCCGRTVCPISSYGTAQSFRGGGHSACCSIFIPQTTHITLVLCTY